MALLDTEGIVQAQLPPVSIRPLDFEPLKEYQKRYEIRKMAAHISIDELGPVIYVAMPFYENNNYAGLLVGYFDPRSLLEFCPNPEDLIIISPEGVLWPGGKPGLADALMSYAWSEELRDEVQGEREADGTLYAWQARWIGQLEIVYVTDSSSARKKAEEEAAAAEAAASGEQPAEAAVVEQEAVVEEIQTGDEVVVEEDEVEETVTEEPSAKETPPAGGGESGAVTINSRVMDGGEDAPAAKAAVVEETSESAPQTSGEAPATQPEVKKKAPTPDPVPMKEPVKETDEGLIILDGS